MKPKKKEKKVSLLNLTFLEKRDWELWTMAILMIMVLTLYILISHLWEMGDSPREWFREFMSVKTYLAGSTFLILMFCLYVVSKHVELRKLRNQLYAQKAELEKMASTLEEITAFYQISSVIIAKQDLPMIFSHIAREALNNLKADRSTIYNLDQESGILKSQITYAPNPLDEKVNLLEEREVAKKSILQDKPFLLSQPEDFAKFYNYQQLDRKIHSLMAIPIYLNGKPAGALSVARIDGRSAFNEENIKMLSIFSNYASIALENSTLAEEVKKKFSHQKKFEKYSSRLMDVLSEFSEEDWKKVEEQAKEMLYKRQSQVKEKITLLSELDGGRRQGERVNEILQVEFEDQFPAQTVNISRGGAFIRTPNPLDLEEEFTLKFHIPDDEEPIAVLCKVVWTNKYGKISEDMPRGMGVKFLNLRPEQRTRIEEFIQLQRSKIPIRENEELPGG